MKCLVATPTSASTAKSSRLTILKYVPVVLHVIKMVHYGVIEAMHYILGYTMGYSLSNSPHYKNILHKQVKIKKVILKWASEKTSKDR